MAQQSSSTKKAGNTKTGKSGSQSTMRDQVNTRTSQTTRSGNSGRGK